MQGFFCHEGRPLLLAHRGASGEAPENTRAAFALAAEQQADGIELDVQLSRDDRVVVFHDQTLTRTTGDSRPVADLTWTELSALDAGSWFSERFAGEPIIDLEEVLLTVPRHWRLNIELKQIDRPAELARRVARLLETVAEPEHILCSSFDTETLRCLAAAAPHLQLGLIFYAWPAEEELLQWPVWCALHTLLTPEAVEQARRHDIRICSWTANTVAEITAQIRLGVDAVISNYPARFRDAIANLSADA